MARRIYITEQDRQRLAESIEVLRESLDKRELPHVRQLEAEIKRAEIILNPQDVPGDVITMRSRVRLREVRGGTTQELTLQYPAEADPQQGAISVLAALGTAMLGYRVGDKFEVVLPKGKREFQVEAILYQPEAAGDYNL
ncbi:MAG: GreA/GreB family elongation factor [Candidatus Hydrogenedentes bacterium]|nr:GreA/GreB family elongation factor [Candidatus Hydrogenedentota bacterium]